MKPHKSTYEPKEAAQFLGITLQQLGVFTAQQQVRVHKYQKREFYLGGELDAVKPVIPHLLGNSQPITPA